MRTLDLGCGSCKADGAFGMDHKAGEGVDLVHDLNKRPWPIESDFFDRVIASHIVEHVEDVVGFFSEIHRTARDGAVVEIATPHFSNRSAYADPTHRHAFSARFVDFIAAGRPWHPSGRFAVARSYLFQHHHDMKPFFADGEFSIESVRLSFARVFEYLGVAALANAKIDFYEFYLAHLFPARDISVRLRVHKKA